MKRFLAFSLALFLPSQVQAVTAGDVLEKMSDDQSGGYVTGAVDMLAQLSEDGRAKCIFDWYYRSGGEGPREVLTVFSNHKELPAVAIIKVLIDRHCK